MIVRSWHGIVPVDKGDAFKAHLMATGVSEVKKTPGNLGAFIYHQIQAEYVHFFMVSYWDSFEAIEAFAGPEPHIAVCYPGDEEYGLISDPIVLHHEVTQLPTKFPLQMTKKRGEQNG